MTQPNLAAINRLLAALDKGKALLVTLDGFAATLPTNHRTQYVVAYPFTGLGAIEQANRASGFHWFEPESMRFFGTKVLRYFGAGVFTTRETCPMGRTAYSVRVADEAGNVSTFGEFHSIARSSAATKTAKHLVALLNDGCTVLDGRGQAFTLDA